MTSRNYNTPTVTADWAASRETSMPVAVAIHAISDSKRAPEAIWEAPTPAEWDHVAMAVEEYIQHGDFDWQERFAWGAEVVEVRNPDDPR